MKKIIKLTEEGLTRRMSDDIMILSDIKTGSWTKLSK